VSGTLTNNGTVSANGGSISGNFGSQAGGGSGGSIYVTTNMLSGSGSFTANGGSGGEAGGGGGRIALGFILNDGFKLNTVTADGGPGGTAGSPGTVVFSTPCNVPGTEAMADAQQVVDESLGTASPVNDLNQDGIVNAVDVQLVINAVLRQFCRAR
jgi:hypothetical protein